MLVFVTIKIKFKPMFVIHNNFIATADDIKNFGDDANIHPVFSSRAIISRR